MFKTLQSGRRRWDTFYAKGVYSAEARKEPFSTDPDGYCQPSGSHLDQPGAGSKCIEVPSKPHALVPQGSLTVISFNQDLSCFTIDFDIQAHGLGRPAPFEGWGVTGYWRGNQSESVSSDDYDKNAASVPSAVTWVTDGGLAGCESLRGRVEAYETQVPCFDLSV